MRIERKRGQVGRMVAVEQAHKRIYDQDRAYYDIATDLYASTGSQEQVAALILQRYGVSISPKTAGTWVNRGLAELKAQVPA